MKQAIFLFSIIIFSIRIFSQNVEEREYDFKDYPENIETIKYEVLSIDFLREFLAFKHMFRLATVYDEIGKIYKQPCDCKYAGMEKYPYAGVVLGTYDLLSRGYSMVYTVYKSTYNKSECMDHISSTYKLDEAKDLFNASRISITQKPKPILFKHPQNNISILNIDGITFKATSENITDEETADMLCISKLYANDNLIYTIKQQDNFIMASSGNIKYLSAYKEGDKIVFLNVFHHTSNMAGIPDKETYNFSPIFTLSDYTTNAFSEKDDNKEKLAKLLSEKDMFTINMLVKKYNNIRHSDELADFMNNDISKSFNIIQKAIDKIDPYLEYADDAEFIERYVKFIMIYLDGDGGKVVPGISYFDLYKKALQTPEEDDDIFFKLYSSEEPDFSEENSYIIRTSCIECEPEVCYSLIGGGKCFNIYLKLYDALNQETNFDSNILELDSDLKYELKDFESQYVYSKEKALKYTDKILSEIALNKEDKTFFETLKTKIKSLPASSFNMNKY